MRKVRALTMTTSPVVMLPARQSVMAHSSMPPAIPMTPDTTDVSTAVAPSSSQYDQSSGSTLLFSGG